MNYEKLSKSKKKNSYPNFKSKIVKIFFYSLLSRHNFTNNTSLHTETTKNFSYLCTSNITWNEYVRRNKRYIRFVG